MKKYSIFLSLFLVLIWIIPSHSMVEVTLFGPQIYEREKGKPFTETHNFTISNLFGTGQLIIHSGDSDKKTRVSSAEIWFNGILIFSQNDFNKNVEILESEVPLAEYNEISVKLYGKPGSYLTVQVIKWVEAEAGAVCGPLGGTVEVNDPLSELFGVRLEIPENAVTEDTIISIKEADINIQYSDKAEVVFAAPPFEINSRNTEPNEPCTIIIPYLDEDNDGYLDGTTMKEEFIQVYYSLDNEDGEYVLAEDFSVDTENNVIIVITDHFSKWSFWEGRWNKGVTVCYEYVPRILPKYKAEFENIVFPAWEKALSNEIKFASSSASECKSEVDFYIGFLDLYEKNESCEGNPGIWFAEKIPAYWRREPIGVYFNTKDHNNNPIYWITSAEDYSDKDHNFCIPTTPTTTKVPFLRTALHEIGHVLGLKEYSKRPIFPFGSCDYSPINDCENGAPHIPTDPEPSCDVGNRTIMLYDERTYPEIPCMNPFISLSCWDVNTIRDHYDLPAQEDSDSDKLGDLCDNCPDTPNPDQVDSDGDRIGDECDAFPDDPNEWDDTDLDGVGDNSDLCPDTDPSIPGLPIGGCKPYQLDDDEDGVFNDGDLSGLTWDNPCTGGETINCDDNCPEKPNPDQADSDGNRVGDACQQGSWSSPQVILSTNSTLEYYGNFSLAVDTNGNWHIALISYIHNSVGYITESSIVYFNESTVSNPEVIETQIMTNTSGSRLWPPCLVTDPNGELHILYSRTNYHTQYSDNIELVYRNKLSNSWSSPQVILSSNSIFEFVTVPSPSLAVDTNGNWHIALTSILNDSVGDTTESSIVYFNESTGSNPEVLERQIMTNTSGSSVDAPCLVTDPIGELHILYRRHSHTQYSDNIEIVYRKKLSNSWSSPQVILSSNSIFEYGAVPSLAVDTNGNWHIALTSILNDSVGDTFEWRIIYFNESTISNPEVIERQIVTNTSGTLVDSPWLVTDPNGELHVIYRRSYQKYPLQNIEFVYRKK